MNEHKILVVDDDKDITDRLTKFLSKEGFTAFGAYSGEQGITLFKTENFDLVLTDMNMAGMDGLDVLKAVKGISPQTEVIMISGYPSVETAVKTIKSGAYDYIQKPINLDELVMLINRCLERKELETKLDTEIKLRQELEKKNQELKNTQAQLLQSEKLAAIGRLASGVAHEINNPLTSVTMNLAFLRDELSAESKKTERIDIIDAEISRVSKIVSSLLNFSRKNTANGKDAKILVDIHEIIEKTLEPIEHQLMLDNISLIRQFGKDLPKVSVSSNQLQQVFLNMIANARDSINEKRDERLGIADLQEGKGKIVITTSVIGGGFLQICFEDTGKGISKEDLSKIFEPFYTTKETGKGTGLGLSISYEIIKNHQGEIEASSELGKGAVFRIKIPISKG